jgi:LSD1 subclass zinc finger protein
MPILVLLLLIAVFAYLWFSRRNSTLRRECRWRLDRSLGPTSWRCAVCGAVTEVGEGSSPRHCLKPEPR